MKKVIILPMDGFSSVGSFIDKMKEIISIPGIKDLIAYIKVNDALHIHGEVNLLDGIVAVLDQNAMFDVKIFLDIKLADTVGTIKNTLEHYISDGVKDRIGIITLSTACSVEGICVAKQIFPNAKITLVSLLTDISKDESLLRYHSDPKHKIQDDIETVIDCLEERGVGDSLPFDALVCSPLEVTYLKEKLSDWRIKFVVPGIRDEWMLSGQQKRCTGVYQALVNGADWVVMGAQITTGNPNMNISPEDSVKRTIAEINRFF